MVTQATAPGAFFLFFRTTPLEAANQWSLPLLHRTGVASNDMPISVYKYITYMNLRIINLEHVYI